MKEILLCEDEPVLARNILRALSSDRVRVHHAATARQTRGLLAERRFDLVLADISLGDGDGIEIVAEAAGRLCDTPVIIMTGQDSVANRARAEEIAVAAFLAKPFALTRLRELVAALAKTGPAVAKRRAPSVVMYSHDTIGLGHMRRNASIARALVARVPDVSVLMLVGSPAGMVFESHPGIDYVKLPSLVKLGRGTYQSGSLRLGTDVTRNMRMSVIDGIVSTFRPDVLLVDHEPAGVLGELAPVLRRLREGGGTRTVLGLRDILDEPQAVAKNWTASGTDRVIAELYDHVFVYGDPEFYPSQIVYGLPSRTEYCGVVTSARRRAGHAPRRVPQRVLVSGGGGRDAYPLIDAAIAAQASLRSASRPEMTIVTGPLMDAELQAEALTRAAPLGIRVLTHVPDLTEFMAQSDLLITMTGYNSINEALALGCAIITVPRLGPSAEQRIRAERLKTLGLACVLPRESLSAGSLARLLTARLDRAAAAPLAMDGAMRAADRLAELIGCAAAKSEEAHALSP